MLSFEDVDGHVISIILNELESSGAEISGSNPWIIDTYNNGVVLKGEWNEKNALLKVSVIQKDQYIQCSQVTNTIQTLMASLHEKLDEVRQAK